MPSRLDMRWEVHGALPPTCTKCGEGRWLRQAMCEGEPSRCKEEFGAFPALLKSHLHCWCERCGARWTELTADTASSDCEPSCEQCGGGALVVACLHCDTALCTDCNKDGCAVCAGRLAERYGPAMLQLMQEPKSERMEKDDGPPAMGRDTTGSALQDAWEGGDGGLED